MLLDMKDQDWISNHQLSAKVSWHTHFFLTAGEYFKIGLSVQ